MILVFGTVCLDRIRRVADLPSIGGYTEVLEEQESLGGEAANTASALVLWRVEVCLVGNALGLGHDGDRLRMHVLEKGLPDDLLHAIAIDGGIDTPVCDVYVTGDGERTMFGRGFATMCPSMNLAVLPYQTGAWFTAESNMRGPSEEATRRAHEAGMRVYTMDFHHHQGQSPPGSIAQFSTDWVGARDNPLRNLAWVEAWSANNRSVAILTDGANGLFLGLPGESARYYPPFPAPEIVDSTGAGDVFRAGVLFGLDRGDPFPRALMFGAAAASLKVATLGANEGVPSRQEVDAHILAHPDVAAVYNV